MDQSFRSYLLSMHKQPFNRNNVVAAINKLKSIGFKHIENRGSVAILSNGNDTVSIGNRGNKTFIQVFDETKRINAAKMIRMQRHNQLIGNWIGD